MKRVLLLIVCVVSALFSVAQDSKVKLYVFDENVYLSGSFYRASSNGKYCVGFTGLGSQSFVWDKDNPSVLEWIPTPEIEGYESNSEVYGVSNNGVMVGIFSDPTAIIENVGAAMVPGMYYNGSWISLERIAGVPTFGSGLDGSAGDVSSDGTKIAGSVYKPNFLLNACLWTNGQLSYSQFTGCDTGQGAKAKAMSDDGSVLGGWAETEEGARRPAIWKPEIVTLGEEGEVLDISPNGKYAVGIVASEPFGMDFKPFVWTEEKGMELISTHDGVPAGYAAGVTDDGTIVGGDAIMSGVNWIIKNGVWYDLDEYLSTFYGFENTSGYILNQIMSVSNDGNVICGYTFSQIPDAGFMVPWVMVIEPEVGVNDHISNDFKVYGKDKMIFVENTSLNNKVDAIAIYDVTGRELKSINNVDEYSQTVDMNGFKSGVYIVKLNVGGTSISKKVSLQ